VHAHAPVEQGNHLVVPKLRLGKDQEDTYRNAIAKARKEGQTESDAVALESGSGLNSRTWTRYRCPRI
jgi:hypothetical protein